MTAKPVVIYKHWQEPFFTAVPINAIFTLPHGSFNQDGAVRQSESFFVYKKKIPKQDFLFENQKYNAPLTMGVRCHGEGSIGQFSLPLTARVFLAVTGS